MWELEAKSFVWAAGSACALHRIPFDASLVLRQHPPPHTAASLVEAARGLGFSAELKQVEPEALPAEGGVVFAFLRREGTSPACELALVARVEPERVGYFPETRDELSTEPAEAFRNRYTGWAIVLQCRPEAANDPDAARPARFGFAWFLPEMRKHGSVWRDVIGASVVLQLLGLGMPLFTQAIIDKVVVHQTESTLLAIGAGMLLFMVGTAILSWVRQYLVLHTGNRIDAVLSSAVVEHLFRLPQRYFEQRSTGVIVARLQGVENIREFLSSAAVTLVIDLPLLAIAVAVMLHYSPPLTAVVLAVLGCIALLSLLVAPIFQRALNEQFLLGARNQAFLTEYVAGAETVKSLQLESQVQSRFGRYLAEFLQSSFRTRQIANSYQVGASLLEQLMTVLVLLVGAWMAMHPPTGADEVFTIGMLVAFQMFAGKLSQPVMRIVGLWQQFQQARLSVQRLGDLMNAPAEPYSVRPSRHSKGGGLIEIEKIAFRHAEDRPWLYQDFSLTVRPGEVVAIVGPSGSGKSTLAKLLQGFYWPSAGQIRLGGIDLRHMSANELRAHFGVVPQETVLFSGTVYDNLLLANPYATFEQVVQACRAAEIHSVIEALPKGYETPVGERGAGLSGGQKQRLAIARALLKQPKVLIFDEATSALDATTASQFARTINALRGQVTMIFITHALPEGLRVDRVVEIGPPRTVGSGHQEERNAHPVRHA